MNREEELARTHHLMRTREDTRAEADVLFGAPAKAMRLSETAKMRKLFVQAPVAQTMAPNLQGGSEKVAVSEKYVADAARQVLQQGGSKGRSGLKRVSDFVTSNAQKGAQSPGKKGKRISSANAAFQELMKTGSVAPNVDAFFEKLANAQTTEAQRRYPELLKVAAPRAGTFKVPDTTLKRPTPGFGENPSKSSLSGGSA